MEAVSPEGYTYYYNSETGGEKQLFYCLSLIKDEKVNTLIPCVTSESSWEKPEGFPSSEQPEPNKEVEGQVEPPAPQTEEEKSSNVEAQVPEDPQQEPSIPKLSFRVRDSATGGPGSHPRSFNWV